MEQGNFVPNNNLYHPIGKHKRYEKDMHMQNEEIANCQQMACLTFLSEIWGELKA